MASGDKIVVASKEHVSNSILDNIVDDINTDDSTKSVSAKQVKILNDRTIKNDEDGVINGSLEVTNKLTKEGSDIYSSVQLQGAIGNINNPLLDLPLNNSLAMKAGVGAVTFSRSSGATYIDRYGVMQIVSDDEPRFEKDGLLIEGASTNKMLYSNTTDNSGGTTTNTENYGIAPDGTTTSIKIEDTADDASQYFQKIIDNGDEAITAGVYTGSVYIRKIDSDFCQINFQVYGDETFAKTQYFDFNTGSITGSDFTVKTVGNGWFRISVSVDNTQDNDYARILVRPATAVSGYDDTLTGACEVWGFQVEKMPFATSYIPTTDQEITRADEYCYVTAYGNLPKELTIVVDAQMNFASNSYPKILNVIDSTNNILMSFDSSLSKLYLDTNGESALGGAITTTEALTRYCSVVSSAEAKIFSGGILLGGSSIDYTPVGVDSDSKIYIGSNSGTDRHLNGHIKNLKIFDIGFTDVEVSLA